MKQDFRLIHFHNCLWASALSGASGTAQFWWWDRLDQQDAYRHYRPLAAFVSDIPFTRGGLRAMSAKTIDAPVRAIGLQGKREAYLWFQHRQANWWKTVVEKADPSVVRGAHLEIRGLEPGEYRVLWWDTNEGKAVREDRVRISETSARLAIPDFSRDIACKIRAQ